MPSDLSSLVHWILFLPLGAAALSALFLRRAGSIAAWLSTGTAFAISGLSLVLLGKGVDVAWHVELAKFGGISLGFETGQETAETLAAFLTRLNRPNVGVTFDPANMILYDKGDAIAALRVLGPWLKHCHIKDARRTTTPGTWGEEVTAGTGEVDWPAFFRTLDELGFSGHLCIEREAGSQRVDDIIAARQMVENLAV